MKRYDSIVVGGGHAGIEAACALSKLGKKIALISLSKNHLAMMPCNPSIGGPAKGILTREIDSLGGVQGYFSDKAMIQIKMLNTSKGPAVRALRAQIDKNEYSKQILDFISNDPNIELIEDVIEELIVEDNSIIGVLGQKNKYYSQTTIITTGTYMSSKILRGSEEKKSGPNGLETTYNLSNSLKKYGFELLRLKTGTPPRVYSSSIDFSEVEEEILDNVDYSFSQRSNVKLTKQISCYLTYTTKETHKIILDNINKSSMYSGQINGIGPRYCPSIEDKVVRFQDKERHQIFYEPETLDGELIYVNGLSTSMPADVQEKMLKTLPGMKNAKVSLWGYAIEYDAISPLEIKSSLETKRINNLFLAGQINGTSGYEEAAAQGLISGINASRKIDNAEPLILRRDQAYIGVLIDDIVTKGTKEPYRMLTSRAEYRLLLRNDNSDKRLSDIAYEYNMISEKEYNEIKTKYKMIDEKIEELKSTFVSSKSSLAKKYNVNNGISYYQLLSRPEVDPNDISSFQYINEITTIIRLGGYIEKQESEARKLIKLENLKIPSDFDYENISNLAIEARQKLNQIKPNTIGQAKRISGVNPADIQMIMFHMKYKWGQSED